MGQRDIRTGREVREHLRQGAALAGAFQRIPAPGVTELCAAAGFDFVILDMEHTPISEERVGELVRAAEAVGIPAIVRVPSRDPVGVSRVLETGCVGIQVPLVRSAAEAEEIVRATRYAPHGTRGLASPRQTRYGMAMSIAEWVRTSVDAVLVVVQIEDRLGVGAVGEIAAVDGVDVVFVGLTDLSADLGVPGDLAHPDVAAAVDAALAAAQAAGKTAGLPARDASSAAQLMRRGAGYVTTDDVRCFLNGATAFLGELRAGS